MIHPRVIGLAGVWRRHWLLTVLLVAAAISLGVFLTEVLCAYSQSDYDFLA
jgi:hypothetical protein